MDPLHFIGFNSLTIELKSNRFVGGMLVLFSAHSIASAQFQSLKYHSFWSQLSTFDARFHLVGYYKSVQELRVEIHMSNKARLCFGFWFWFGFWSLCVTKVISPKSVYFFHSSFCFGFDFGTMSRESSKLPNAISIQFQDSVDVCVCVCTYYVYCAVGKRTRIIKFDMENGVANVAD